MHTTILVWNDDVSGLHQMYEWLYTHVPLTQQHVQYRQHWINIIYVSIWVNFHDIFCLSLSPPPLFGFSFGCQLAGLSFAHVTAGVPHRLLNALPRCDILFFTTGESSSVSVWPSCRQKYRPKFAGPLALTIWPYSNKDVCVCVWCMYIQWKPLL